MIPIIYNNFNTLSQIEYNIIIKKQNIHTCCCPNCGHQGLHRHAHYHRKIITNHSKITIRILRVICPECHKTHALIPISIIPYRLYPLRDIVDVIRCFKDKNDYFSLEYFNPNIDTCYIRYLTNLFHHSLFFHSIDLSLSLFDLCMYCIKHFKRNFMQTKYFYHLPT